MNGGRLYYAEKKPLNSIKRLRGFVFYDNQSPPIVAKYEMSVSGDSTLTSNPMTKK